MDTLRVMLLSLMIGATASSGGGYVDHTASLPEAVVVAQQGLAQASTQTIVYVTPAPTAKPASTAAVSGYTRQLSRGSEGDDVRAVQKLLQDLGYKVTVDGNFGMQTKEAVMAFQRNNSLKADGVVGSKTYRVLTSGSAKSADSEPASPRSTLSYGMTGIDVKELQTRLLALHYYTDKISGNYLTNTQNAVRWFQQVNGLTVDGVAGAATLAALYSVNAVEAPSLLQPQGFATLPPRAATATPAPVRKALARGMSGSDVTLLQSRLKELGYFTGQLTDFFGEATEQAVRLFQSMNGLGTDGIAGSATWSRLFSAGAVSYSGTTVFSSGSQLAQNSGAKCSHCGEVINPGEAALHTTLARCGTHRTCERGEHNKSLGPCGHFECQDRQGAVHAMLICGVHYACQTTDLAVHTSRCAYCGKYFCSSGAHGPAPCGYPGHLICDGGQHAGYRCGIHYQCEAYSGQVGDHQLTCVVCGRYYCDPAANKHAGCQRP